MMTSKCMFACICLFYSVSRCLGLPCRVITNFGSAHDTDLSCTIDYHFKGEGANAEEMKEYNSDSVWYVARLYSTPIFHSGIIILKSGLHFPQVGDTIYRQTESCLLQRCTTTRSPTLTWTPPLCGFGGHFEFCDTNHNNRLLNQLLTNALTSKYLQKFLVA